METIRKKINLEPTKNRYINKQVNDKNDDSKNNYLNKSYYYSNNTLMTDGFSWGGNCVDLLIPYRGSLITLFSINRNIYNWCTYLYNLNCDTCKLRIPMMLCDKNCQKIYKEDGKTFFNINNVELEYNEKEHGKLYIFIRYKNLLEYYNWIIKKFIPSCTFYRVCKRGYLKEKQEFDDRIENLNKFGINNFLSNYNVTMVNSLPSLTEAKINSVYCQTNLYDEFIDKFDTLSVAGAFVRFCNYYFNKGINGDLSSMKYCTPYITVPLTLTQDAVEIGEYSDTIEQWVPKKKYYLGDIVYYNGETYILNCGENYDETIVSGEKFDFSGKEYRILQKNEKPKQDVGIYYNEKLKYNSNGKIDFKTFFNAINPITIIEYNDTNEYGIIQPYHTGVYDKLSKTIKFDTTTYWKRIGNQDYINQKIISGVEYDYRGVVESHLNNYKKKRVSVSDDGKMLPFIIEYQSSTYSLVDGVKILKDDIEHDTSLPFKIGEVSVEENVDGTKTIDEITCIGFYKTNTRTEDDVVEEFKTTGDIIKYSDIENINDAPYIGFKYVSGKIIDKDGVKIIEPGLSYEERYSYNKSKMENVEIDGKGGLTFKYIDIKFNQSEIVMESNKDITFLSDNPLYANVVVDKDMIKSSDTFNYAPIYKDESLLGVLNVNSDINIEMSRGISAAFERHQILGEIKTFQDLQNFRNNYFEI